MFCGSGNGTPAMCERVVAREQNVGDDRLTRLSEKGSLLRLSGVRVVRQMYFGFTAPCRTSDANRTAES